MQSIGRERGVQVKLERLSSGGANVKGAPLKWQYSLKEDKRGGKSVRNFK